MSHTFEARNGTRFHYNPDFSGYVEIPLPPTEVRKKRRRDDDGYEIRLLAEDLLEFANSQHKKLEKEKR